MLSAHAVLLTAVLAAVAFAGAAYLGMALSKIVMKSSGLLERHEENGSRPAPLICAGAACGAILALRGLLWQDLAMAAVLCICLIACLHEAVETGKMSDYFILIPLSSVILADFAEQSWLSLLGPLIPFILFSVPAYASKGKNMGWDDAKLAALGGAVLGAWFALVAFTAACLAAAVVARFRKKTREPIVFAPYMIGSIALCALLTIARAS